MDLSEKIKYLFSILTQVKKKCPIELQQALYVRELKDSLSRFEKKEADSLKDIEKIDNYIAMFNKHLLLLEVCEDTIFSNVIKWPPSFRKELALRMNITPGEVTRALKAPSKNLTVQRIRREALQGGAVFAVQRENN